MIPLPSDVVGSAQHWFGAYAQKYGFYTTKQSIYKYDYLNISSFPEKQIPFISFPSNYEIIDIFLQLGGTGLRDQDDCAVVLLYDAAINKTSIYVYETVSGEKIIEYKDVIPGKGVYFIKR